MSIEERHKATQRLAEETQLLLKQSERENLHWAGSRIDLMEALHEAYLSGAVRDEEGRVMTFMQLVRRACKILHIPVPRNPYDCARRGQIRKGMINSSYLERYSYLLNFRGNQEPLWEEIR